MHKCGNVAIFWALLASMDLILGENVLITRYRKYAKNKDAPTMTLYHVPRILLYIHAVLSILPNQSPQKELLSEDELIACFPGKMGEKKLGADSSGSLNTRMKRRNCIKQGGEDLRALRIFSDKYCQATSTAYTA